MDAQALAAVVQAVAAVVIVFLTVQLAGAAKNALSASDRQIAETRRDRHLGAVPMLGIMLNPLDTAQVNRVLSVVYITNASDNPALNVRASFGEAWDFGRPTELRVATPAGLPVVAPHAQENMPVELSRFPRADPPRVFHTNWVVIHVEYEGLLGAKVRQEWYWEPFEWEGMNEPVPGHGEKLILWSVKGSSGADPTVEDIDWRRGSQ